ncbi:hypothetical protein BH11ACT6_BH11ACT6_34560 [soil metagenome]
MTTYHSATGAKTPTPRRAAVEEVLGQQLLDWQWNTLLGVLGHLPSRPPIPAPSLPKLDKPLSLNKLQDHPDFRHTCEICGRTGSRRFHPTPTGWRCTAYEVCAGRAATTLTAAQPEPSAPAEPVAAGLPELCTACGRVEADPHVCATAPDPRPVADAPADVPSGPNPAPASARCQNCPRTFTLTGRNLRGAVDMHEFKTGHIVDMLDVADA